ncbi:MULTISPECIES: hypothetical protein [unclassified Arcicella]|uniref:hypothetical protein n=1 Tax=unclassified Arcicella TaxID=2644986 RepID=UPI00285C2D9C|nr:MULTISPECIES: hypothetical protein [unclassified Arcicella]MDR6564950.1 hypothetical protein [Arcicella sp. BE51]MDR6814740.1 hypothetical protein [Arcicella sp. BE140]MDR6826186.1 hypothetical protein [Arcicella sp. BE139]
MAGIVGSLPVKGTIKQGGIIGVIDFGKSLATGVASKLTVFLCVFGGVPYLFKKLSTASGSPVPFTSEDVVAIGKTDLGVLWDIANLASHPAQVYANYGISYVEDTDTDVFYTDGAGAYKATPYTDVSASESLSTTLAKIIGTTADATTPVVDVPWYKKTVTYVITGIVVVGGAIWYYFANKD